MSPATAIEYGLLAAALAVAIIAAVNAIGIASDDSSHTNSPPATEQPATH